MSAGRFLVSSHSQKRSTRTATFFNAISIIPPTAEAFFLGGRELLVCDRRAVVVENFPNQ